MPESAKQQHIIALHCYIGWDNFSSYKVLTYHFTFRIQNVPFLISDWRKKYFSHQEYKNTLYSSVLSCVGFEQWPLGIS